MLASSASVRVEVASLAAADASFATAIASFTTAVASLDMAIASFATAVASWVEVGSSELDSGSAGSYDGAPQQQAHLQPSHNSLHTRNRMRYQADYSLRNLGKLHSSLPSPF